MGIALGFFHGPSTNVIGQYFEKRRSLANACMAAGGSIGGLVLPSLFQNLLETYGLRGALLLTSAVIFHTSIGAMLMRPPTYYIQPGNQDVHLMKENKEDDGPITNGKHQGEFFNDEPCQLSAGNMACSAHHKHSSYCPKNISDSGVKPIGNDLLAKSKLDDIDNEMDHHVRMFETSQNSYRKRLSGNDYIRNSNVSKFDKHPGTSSISMAIHECTDHTDGNQHCKEYHLYTEDTEVLPLDSESRQTLQTSGVVRKAKGSQYTLFPSHGDLFTNSLTDISQLQASADFSAQETTGDLNGPDRERKSCLSVILNDLSLLRNPVMVLFLFVYCMGSIGSAYGHIYITALARDIGINSGQITLLVSTLSGCDVIGRLICGAVVDRRLMTSYRVTSLTVLITGLMMLLAHLFQEFWSLLLYSILHGLFAGGIFALTPAILIDMLGFENFRNAMGIAIFAQGFSLVSSAPFIGMQRAKVHEPPGYRGW
ncbi:uncharacterized protein LOC110462436 [Mizuhopecten yessoensis]|uniref:uncharacterized protein LOC110462436 n=1 Tax=Mizuhopecten yessoensis TaxID=6573 RepID=UPI000B45BC77|nr:uncharacterized protein LOC110462436 [Mizuhopecten yessoensis]